ncbi:MAG: DNA-binding response regulator [Prevotella sp.]
MDGNKPTTGSPAFILSDNQAVTRAGIGLYIHRLFPQATITEANDKRMLAASLGQTEGKAVVVLDYALSSFNSIDDLLIMQKRFPHSFWLLFSDGLSEPFIRRISMEQSFGILLKDSSQDEITTALGYARRHESYFCIQVRSLLNATGEKPEPSPLTPTEKEILKLIARGKSVKEIAAERFSSTHTIITHKKNIFRKIGVCNVHEATKYALRSGLVEIMEYYI